MKKLNLLLRKLIQLMRIEIIGWYKSVSLRVQYEGFRINKKLTFLRRLSNSSFFAFACLKNFGVKFSFLLVQRINKTLKYQSVLVSARSRDPKPELIRGQNLCALEYHVISWFKIKVRFEFNLHSSMLTPINPNTTDLPQFTHQFVVKQVVNFHFLACSGISERFKRIYTTS